MKKKVLAALLAATMVLSLTACAKKSNHNNYDMDEFLDMWTQVCADVDTETEYWTDEEKKGEKYYEEFAKAGKKIWIEPRRCNNPEGDGLSLFF